ncbi:MAG: ATP-binding protein [Spirulina sp. SIO3F2]|nr:ATP-binding protein [Spirulina sp. SIO3F2]
MPPFPGDPVSIAADADLALALHFDRMEQKIPAGILRNGNPAHFNFEFINGDKGAHINISGISGVATKTSYALFLLHAIFNSEILGAQRANTKALIFNVKGEDLFFLDKANADLNEESRQTYQNLGLPIQPFQDVRFCAAPRKAQAELSPDLNQRSEGITPYVWSIRQLCRDRLFPFLFAGEDLERGNLGFLVSGVTERLARLAEDCDRQEQRRGKPRTHLIADESYGEAQTNTISTFRDLINFLEYKLLDEDGQDRRWLGRNAQATAEALIRRLWGIANEMSHIIRGDLAPEVCEKYHVDPLAPAFQLSIVDINKLGNKAQKFVVGVLLQTLFTEKEKRGKEPIVFIVLDELNKYAPRSGNSPIKNLLVEIAERGRSLGIILIGAQQTASEVERRVVGQASMRVVGRLDAAEAERAEYNFLTGTCRQRVLLLQSGSLFVSQPQVPAPLLVGFPFPAYATRQVEVQVDAEQKAKQKTKVKRLKLD